MKPGILDISAEAYHADCCPEPSLSASIGKMLVTPGFSPLHAFTESPRLNPDHERNDTEAFDLGKAAHSMILRDPQAFEVIYADDWRTKIAKEKREEARAAGKIPLLEAQYEACTEMVRAARRQLDQHEEAFTAFTDGKPEQTLIWKEGDVWLRARLDWLPNSGDILHDYKSTGASADPDLWSRTMFGIGADFQAAFYARGARALGIGKRPQVHFVVQENYKPYALSVIGLMPGALDLAERDVEIAIRKWDECRKLKWWPGYPRRTCFVDSPPWREAQKMEREQREEDIRRTPSKKQVNQAIEMQEPL